MSVESCMSDVACQEEESRLLNYKDGESAFVLEGHIDFYGYHGTAGGVFFCGWITYPWPNGERPKQVTAHLRPGETASSSLVTFYSRDDVRGRGIGFVFFMECTEVSPLDSPSVDIEFSGVTHSIYPTMEARHLDEAQLLDWLHPILAGGEEDSHRRRMYALLIGQQSEISAGTVRLLNGFIDFYGHHSTANGWLFCGWLSETGQDDVQPEKVIVSFEGGDITGEAIAAFYPRQDLTEGNRGVVIYVAGAAASLHGALCSMHLQIGGARAALSVGPALQRLREQELNTRLRPILAGTTLTPSRDILMALLARQPYAGQDTLGTLADRIFFEIDEAIFCEPDSLVLMGWFLAKPGAVREIRLRCGALVSPIRFEDCIRVDRPDVLAAIGAEHGYDDPRCGFVAFLPRSVVPGAPIYVEIETRRREVAFRNVPAPKLEGMAAIKRLVGSFDIRFVGIAHAYDRVIGPIVERLNRARLRASPSISVVDYGPVLSDPEFSVIVPVYGRLDLVEYQLGLLSSHTPAGGCEIIYVLDDPPRQREAQFLFESLYERFRVPFRALLLDRNLGFAPANNIGLKFATGTFVAFVNSDVFPGTHDWLERLAGHLRADPTLGAVGPLLLFDDGSVQHQGMYFKRLSEFGGWLFGQHSDKGKRYAGGSTVHRCISITGACMVMKRAVAEEVGGFDEAYIIGDFEDSDLCLKLHRMGLECAVDPKVRLYHLERKSQAGSALTWRMNLTLYNAWVHERRWAEIIEAHPYHRETSFLAEVA